MSYTELTALFKLTTTPLSATDEAEEKTFMANLGTDLGAPFELYIKQTGSIGTSGILNYTDGVTGTSVNNRISADESREIGNNIHRILKYYLGSNYVVDDISQVRLNVAFKN